MTLHMDTDRYLFTAFRLWRVQRLMRGVLGLMLIGSVGLMACQPQPPPRPHVVLITIDTLRADHLESYGYTRPTSPHLRALAARGVVFEHAMSQAPWTLPSMATVHTSRYPIEHGAVRTKTRPAERFPTLAQALRAAGYRTIGVVSHTFVAGKYGFDRGFDVFDTSNVQGHAAVTSETVTAAALKHVGAEQERPTFLWVHYFDPHGSYVRHPEFAFADGYTGKLGEQLSGRRLHRRLRRKNITKDDLSYVIGVYDEEIAYTDHWIGQLIDGLKTRWPRRPTVFVVTADHGEYFLERGRFFHGRDVYRELIHVPLIVAGDIEPGLHGRRVSMPVELASIARTLSRVAGLADQPFQGVDLLAVARGEVVPQYVFSEGLYAGGTDQRKISVLHGVWKLILNRDDSSYELYNTELDPAERRNRWESPEARAVQDTLRAVIAEYEKTSQPDTPHVELSPQVRERLRSLGYLGQ